MIKLNRFYVFLLVISLFMAGIPITQADMPQQSYSNKAGTALQQSSYGEKIGNKALNAVANLIGSPLEIPKDIISTMNQSNFFYGVFGGFLKGLVNTLGRAGCGITDLITLPIPTKSIAHPLYIWDDFDIETTYGEVLRLDETQITIQPIIAPPTTPAISVPAPLKSPANSGN